MILVFVAANQWVKRAITARIVSDSFQIYPFAIWILWFCIISFLYFIHFLGGSTVTIHSLFFAHINSFSLELGNFFDGSFVFSILFHLLSPSRAPLFDGKRKNKWPSILLRRSLIRQCHLDWFWRQMQKDLWHILTTQVRQEKNTTFVDRDEKKKGGERKPINKRDRSTGSR